MTNRREAVAGLAAGAAVLMLAREASAKPVAVSAADALKALNPWADALFVGTPKAVFPVLAAEFQITRSDGTGFDKAGYLKNLPKQKKRNAFSDIVATGTADVMVIRYMVDADQVIAGKSTVGKAPRISTFRRHGKDWLMSSHANFSPLG